MFDGTDSESLEPAKASSRSAAIDRDRDTGRACTTQRNTLRPALAIGRAALARQGIATALVAHLEAAVWELGGRAVYLETHAAWTEAAAPISQTWL